MRGRKPGTITAGSSSLSAVPRPPVWLSKPAKTEWRKVAAILTERGHLTEADLGTLGAYCDACGQLEAATRQVAQDGLCIMTSNGLRKHPAVAIQINARQQIRQLAAELGLTPVSRSRPTMQDRDDEDLAFLDG